MMNTILRPVIIKLGEHNYYNTKDLQIYDPIYFHGCSRGVRKILEKKTIEVSKYKYATWCKKNNWKLSANQIKPSTKASLLLDETWVIENIPKMMPNSNKTKYEYEEAPKIIHLEDEEKFKDDEGKHVDIETRGYRSHSGIYFLAKDVATAFEMPSLVKNVHESTNTQYIINEHYKTFVCNKVQAVKNMRNKKQLFITYKGMLKILFSSRTGKANKFVDWATETLFTVQMGFDKDKKILSSKLLGVSPKVVSAVLKKSATTLPAIYLFTLGIAKDLRKSMKLDASIPDTSIIAKYGRCGDLETRKNDHVRTYEKIKGVNLQLIHFAWVDPMFVTNAETNISHYFEDSNMKIKYENHNELIAYAPQKLKNIKEQYLLITTLYAGHHKELLLNIENLKKDILIKDKEINSLSEKHDLELKLKDLKIELLELKLSIK
jgi:hypothetical protein